MDNRILFDVLNRYFLSIGFKKKRKDMFIRKFDDGYHFIKLIVNRQKNTLKLSYQIGFHLYEIEKTAADLQNKKYSSNSITGSCNIGHLLDPPIYYEQLTDYYISEADILFDTSYHIEKYVYPVFNKFNSLNSFLNSDKLNEFNINFFNKTAFFIAARDFKNALDKIDNCSKIFFNEDDKKRCISKIKAMEELF